jgi:multidrug efflux system membrane fusion protein
LVGANNETLVIVNQITPVFATFSVPEQSLWDLRRYAAGGKLKVQAIPKDGDPRAAAHGVLDFLDNRVDAATGTILLKARFPNQDRKLWPGQFVNVNVQLTVSNEIVAPTAAVRTGQQGNYVFVVKPDMTAEQRTIQTARAYEEFTVIQSGLNAGERVIVEGQVRVKNGSKVRISGHGSDVGQPGGTRSDGSRTEKAALEH